MKKYLITLFLTLFVIGGTSCCALASGCPLVGHGYMSDTCYSGDYSYEMVFYSFICSQSYDMWCRGDCNFAEALHPGGIFYFDAEFLCGFPGTMYENLAYTRIHWPTGWGDWVECAIDERGFLYGNSVYFHKIY